MVNQEWARLSAARGPPLPCSHPTDFLVSSFLIGDAVGVKNEKAVREFIKKAQDTPSSA